MDDEQLAPVQSMVRKLRTFADQERTDACQALEQRLADPTVADPISERLRATQRQATPEAQALALIARNVK